MILLDKYFMNVIKYLSNIENVGLFSLAHTYEYRSLCIHNSVRVTRTYDYYPTKL